MDIIDAHVHIFPKIASIFDHAPLTGEPYGLARNGTRLIPFLPPSFEQPRSTPEMLLAYMDRCGISRAVLVSNPYYGYFNDYTIAAVQKWPDRFRGVALVDLLRGRAAAEELAGLFAHTPLMGFKAETLSAFQCAPGKRLDDEDLLPVWDCCCQYRQPVFLHLFTDADLLSLRHLIALFPDITWIVCHLGADACHRRGAPAENMQELLRLLRTQSNVYADTSTLPVYFDEEYPFPSSAAILRRAWREAGPDKLLYASDYPGMLNHATMEQLLHLTQIQAGIPEPDLRLILAGNAERLFFS
jgi:predicted TIM-barrel fold metal-dependent hydrolase